MSTASRQVCSETVREFSLRVSIPQKLLFSEPLNLRLLTLKVATLGMDSSRNWRDSASHVAVKVGCLCVGIRGTFQGRAVRVEKLLSGVGVALHCIRKTHKGGAGEGV